ncbi:hypothetical protein ABE957_04945 [Halomonas sp. CS7]|uniref:Tetratricopeptide repeat protein n=1 Tax=Halomonas pelophila TaxID=3151122 RepID=A0ABV1N2T4_9GAMM
MNMRRALWVFATTLILVGCAASPYGTPPATSDPWELVHSARAWLEQGRPRGALPSLHQAQRHLEGLDPEERDYRHLEAAIMNEYGRVYEMTSDLDEAEVALREAGRISDTIPEIRPLAFDIHYNLSTVLERQERPEESCTSLRRAHATIIDLGENPSPPPEGYGGHRQAFIDQTVMPRIEARADRIDCRL